jgi:hypothetical protein
MWKSFEEFREYLVRYWVEAKGTRAHLEQTLLALVSRTRTHDCSVHDLDREAGVVEEHLSRGRHLHMNLVPNEELNPEHALEALDLLREPGLRDSKARSGSTEMQFFRYSDEISKLSQLERQRALHPLRGAAPPANLN